MCVLALIVAYTDRVNVSVASVAMLEQFHWTHTRQGYVLSAFFVGYMLCMVPSGWLAARFGGKIVLGMAVVWWSLLTLLTPPAASVSFGALIAVRIGLGIGEAAVIPASYELFGRWVPAAERSRAVARFLSGVPLGQIIGFAATGWLTARYGWPASFYVFAAFGFVWAASWVSSVVNDPAADLRVTPEERHLLLDARGEATSTATRESVITLVSTARVWAIFVSHFCNNWVLYLLIAWLPSYFHAMGLDYGTAGLYAAAPWLAGFVTANLAGNFADRAIATGTPIVLVRKVTVAVSMIGAAAFLILVRDVHSPPLALVMVCAAAGSLTIGWSGFAANLLDIAPGEASVLMGISNTLATIPGIVGVALTGWLLDRTGGYSATFLLTAGIATAGAFFYCVFASDGRNDLKDPRADSPA